MTTSSVIVEYGSKNVNRKRKISKIFDLDLKIKDEFSTSKSVIRRHSKKIIKSRYYKNIEIKKLTL